MMLTRFELIVMIAMALGIIMDGLDSSIINIAIPVIAETFGTDTSAIAWVTIVYFIMIAGLMLAFGRIADTGHIKKVYVAGFAIFAGGSFLCGISQSLEFMIFTRVIQGLGAAMLAAVAPMMCVKFLPPNKLGLGMAIIAIGGAIGFGLGPAVGGLIIEFASWHWTFFINVPIGLIGIAIAMRGLPKDTANGKIKLDVPGTVLLFVAVLCGVLALELFSYPGYEVTCIILAVLMLILLFAFAIAEKKVKLPMLNLKMFRDWKFVSLSACYLVTNISYMGVFYIIPFLITLILGMDMLSTGLILLIPSVISGTISIPIGRWCDVHGRRGVSILCALFLVLVSVCYYLFDPNAGWIGLTPALLAAGVMWGIVGSSTCSRIIDVAHGEDKGMASTISNFLYYTGGSIGTALFASLLTFGAGSAGTPVEEMTAEAFMNGYYFAMLCAIAISFLAVLTATVVNENKSQRS